MSTLWTGIRIALCVGLGILPGGTAFAQGGKVQVQWLGQSATKITTPSGKVIVIDPWLINNPDLIMIPIGGHFVMDPVSAAMITRDFLKPKFAIPIHYGTIPQLKGTPEEYIKALGTTSTKVMVMNPGDKVEF